MANYMDENGNKYVDEIIPHLYLGGASIIERDPAFLRDTSLIVNCTKHPHPYPLAPLTLHLNVEDIGYMDKQDLEAIAREEEVMKKHLEKIIDVIHTFIGNNQKVFVHCKHGLQRSATIVVAYLRKHHPSRLPKFPIYGVHYTGAFLLDRAIDLVRTRRNIFDWMISFRKVLVDLDHRLYQDETKRIH